MNATFLAAIGLSMAAVLPGSEVTSQQIRQFPQSSERVVVYSNGFDTPSLDGMSLDRCAKLILREGVNGGSSLRIRCDAAEKGRAARLELPDIIPGARYLVSVSVRAEDLKFQGKRKSWYACIATHQRDITTGKIALSKYSVIPFTSPPGQEFKQMEYSFVGLEGKRPTLTLWLKEEWGGTIWFSDVRVWRAGVATTTLFTYPRQNTFFAGEGKFIIHADAPQGIQTAAVVGLEKDGAILNEQVVLADERGNVCGNFGSDLPPGSATVRVLLADLKKRQLLEESTFPVTIRNKKEVPRNAAILDEHDRLLIDGKPLMPLGLYISSRDEEREAAYRDISEGGFNCVLDYSVLGVSRQEPDRLKAAVGRLDLARRYKLKQIFSIAGLHRQGAGDFLKGALGESDREKVTEKLIHAFKDHPALMGWYIADELAMSEIPEVTKVKDHVNSLDPWHPVITLTNKPADLPQYALSGNVFMPDAYPLRSENAKDVGEYLEVGMVAARRSGLPVWAVPQAFGWGVVSAETAKDYQKHYLPTEEDMRSMALHFAIDGAKGFVFYNYPSVGERKRAAKCGDDGLFDRVWPRVKGMAQSIKLLEPFVTSLRVAPAVAVENQAKARVRALAYTAENGKNCLIVVGCGGGNAAAVITAAGLTNLKSRFGRTENLGGGNYRFTSPDLGSDMLFD